MTERECLNGRRRYRSRKEAEQLAAEFEGSSLTQEEFCERNDVSRNALARYVKRRRGREGGGPADRGRAWADPYAPLAEQVRRA